MTKHRLLQPNQVNNDRAQIVAYQPSQWWLSAQLIEGTTTKLSTTKKPTIVNQSFKLAPEDLAPSSTNEERRAVNIPPAHRLPRDERREKKQTTTAASYYLPTANFTTNEDHEP